MALNYLIPIKTSLMKKVALVLMAFLPLFASANDWIQINEQGNAILFVDRDSIKVVDQYRLYDSQILLQKPQYLDKVGVVSEQKSKYIVNCKNYTFSLISSQLFDPEKKLVSEINNTNFKGTFKVAPKNSLL